MLRNDTIRSILESGGFVLEEVLRDAGSVLTVCTAGMSHEPAALARMPMLQVPFPSVKVQQD
jgi:hypothetical protein